MRVFVDSSVFIEHYAERRPELLDALFAREDTEICVSSEVASEYYYKFIGMKGERSPRSVQQSGKIAEVFNSPERFLMGEDFTVLPDSTAALKTAERLIGQYNLLPNDALILAVCLEHEVECLASLDGDFFTPCQKEGVRLLGEAGQLTGLV